MGHSVVDNLLFVNNNNNNNNNNNIALSTRAVGVPEDNE